MQRGGFRELISGSRNGEVMLWDIRREGPVREIRAMGDTLRTLSVHEHAPVFATSVIPSISFFDPPSMFFLQTLYQYANFPPKQRLRHPRPHPLQRHRLPHQHHPPLQPAAHDGEIESDRLCGVSSASDAVGGREYGAWECGGFYLCGEGGGGGLEGGMSRMVFWEWGGGGGGFGSTLVIARRWVGA